MNIPPNGHLVHMRYHEFFCVEENKIVEQKHEELKKIVAEKTGKDNLVPRDYPEPFHTQWEDIQKQFNYESSYPFSEDNVIDFMRFCRESGGFQIC